MLAMLCSSAHGHPGKGSYERERPTTPHHHPIACYRRPLWRCVAAGGHPGVAPWSLHSTLGRRHSAERAHSGCRPRASTHAHPRAPTRTHAHPRAPTRTQSQACPRASCCLVCVLSLAPAPDLGCMCCSLPHGELVPQPQERPGRLRRHRGPPGRHAQLAQLRCARSRTRPARVRDSTRSRHASSRTRDRDCVCRPGTAAMVADAAHAFASDYSCYCFLSHSPESDRADSGSTFRSL